MPEGDVFFFVFDRVIPEFCAVGSGEEGGFCGEGKGEEGFAGGLQGLVEVEEFGGEGDGKVPLGDEVGDLVLLKERRWEWWWYKVGEG